MNTTGRVGRFGATIVEAEMPLADRIWRWLAQIGQERDGFYSDSASAARQRIGAQP
jgi:hypothetical protein